MSTQSPATSLPEAQGWLGGLLRNRLVFVGGCFLALLVLVALTAPLWVKAGLLRDPIQQVPTGLDEDGMPLLAGGPFLAGTDNLGRDVFSRVVYGTRVSLTVGVAGMLTAMLIGVVVGVIAGFRGGKLDLLLMRFTEMNMTLPDIRAAQAALWKTGLALEGPDSDALKGDLRENGGQGVHFSGPGLREHAARWAEKVAPWLERQLK